MAEDKKIEVEIEGKVNPSFYAMLDKVTGATTVMYKRMETSSQTSFNARMAALTQYYKVTSKHQQERYKGVEQFYKFQIKLEEQSLAVGNKIRAVKAGLDRKYLSDWSAALKENATLEKRLLKEIEGARRKTASVTSGGGIGGGGGFVLPSGGGGFLTSLGPVGAAVTAINQSLEVMKKLWYAMQIPVSVIAGLLKKGVEYNDLIINSQYGFAGLIFQMTDIYKGQTKLTDETEKWNGALSISKQLTEQLQGVALRTRVVYSELARGMQEGLGPMLTAGLQEKDIAPFVERFVKVMSGLQIKAREIGQEMRALIGGQTDPRTARVGNAVMQQWLKQTGKTVTDYKRELQKMMSEGTFDEWFMSMTAGLGKAGEASMKTLGGFLSNMRELLERALGMGTQELYKNLVDIIESATNQLVTFDAKGKAVFNSTLIETIKGVASAFGLVAKAIASMTTSMIGSGGMLDSYRIFFHEMKKDLDAIATFILHFGGTGKPDRIPTGNSPVAQQTKADLDILNNSTESFNKFFGWRKEKQNDVENWLLNQNSSTLPKGFLSAERASIPGRSSEQAMGVAGYQSGTTDNPRFKTTAVDLEVIAANKAAAEKVKADKREAERQVRQAAKQREDTQKAYDKYLNGKGNAQRDADLNLRAAQGETVFIEYEKAINSATDSFEEQKDVLENWRVQLGLSKVEVQNITYDLLKMYETQEKIAQITLDEKFAKILEKGRSFSDIIKEQTEQSELDTEFTQTLLNGRTFGDIIKKSQQIDPSLVLAKAGQFAENFSRPLGDAILGLAENGGKGFAESMAYNFRRLIQEGAFNLGDKIGNLLGFGGKLTEKDGNLFIDGKLTNDKKDWERRFKKQDRLQAGMAVGSVAIGAYSNARANPKGSLTAGALGGALAGASMGNPYAAVALALVGYTSALLGKKQAQKEYQFARPGFDKTGKAFLTGSKNITPAESEQMLSDMNSAMEKWWGSLSRLAIKIGADIPLFEGLTKKIQDNPSANFMKHFQEWLNRDLPQELMGDFKKGLTDAFVKMGMTAERFQGIWDKFSNLDPEKMLEILNLVADSLKNYKKYTEIAYDGNSEPFTKSSSFASFLGDSYRETEQTYAQRFKEADKEIENFAKAMSQMPKDSEEYFRMQEQMSGMLLGRMEQMRDLADEIAGFLTDTTRSFEAMRRDIIGDSLGKIETDKDGNRVFKPDYEAQMKYYNDYNQTIMRGIQGSRTLEELNYWKGEFTSNTSKMGGIAQQMGPDQVAAFNKWLIGEDGKSGTLGLFQTEIERTVGRWSLDITNQNKDLFATMQPIIADFNGNLTGAGNAGKELGGGFREILKPVKDLVPVLGELRDAVVSAAEGINGVTFTGGSGGGNSSSDRRFENSVIMRRKDIA